MGLIEVEFAIKGEFPYDIRESIISIVDDKLEFLTAAELGSVIRQRRKALGLTQTDLARKLNVSVGIVSYWEREIKAPKPSNIRRLLEVLFRPQI